MAKSRELRAADKRVVGWGLAAWLTLTIGGAFWALPHIEDELDEESLDVDSYMSADDASVEWNGRDGYLRVPEGTPNASAIAADLASIDGARDVEIQFDTPVNGTASDNDGGAAAGDDPALVTATAPAPATTEPATTEAPATTEPATTEAPATTEPATTGDQQTLAAEALDSVLGSAGIEFLTGTSTPTAATEGSIDQIAEVLRTYDSVSVIISGHTDTNGSATSNQALSERRAEAVKAGLVQRGIDPTRLDAVGFGGEQPIDTNLTPDGRQRNRRVDIDVKDNE